MELCVALRCFPRLWGASFAFALVRVTICGAPAYAGLCVCFKELVD